MRFRWSKGVTIEEMKEALMPPFQIEMTPLHTSDTDLSLLIDSRQEFKVAADTLTARLSRFRAVLTQREAAAFTAKDMELRKKIFELYPKDRITPFPWGFSEEPRFRVA